MSKRYTNHGTIDIDGADHANVPVDIWLSPPEGDHPEEWELSADNYMPRKGCLSGSRCRGSAWPYIARSKSREVLVGLVRSHWLPLFVTATEIIRDMEQDEDGSAALYYWGEP